ncbi:MAG: glycosyltransferase family 4 protein, partial [Verrucomicrobiota bacterium]|nr:glycosyltransferase family 4 protein [Verrucomicrobiota bacterium]
GSRYSFTGHANDIFCEHDSSITNEMLVRDAAFVVTESDYARQWMEQKYAFARGKIHRVFNGITTADFPRRQRLGAGSRIVSVGRYVEKKGFADLIEACRLLKHRGRPFECVIVGGGPLEAELRVQIEVAQLQDRVSLIGPLPQAEVRQFLARAHVFVLACVPESGGGSDNLPTVIMEAMLSGVPVVSTRLAGVPEMVEEGVEGLLVAPHDPPALAQAIETFLQDPHLAERCGHYGRATATAKFAIENTTRELKHLLVRLARVPVPPDARRADPSLPGSRLLDRLFRR